MFQSLVANTVSNMDNCISKPQPFQDSNYKEINLLQVQTWPSHCKPPLTVLRSSQDRELLFSARSLNLQGWSSPTSADVSVTHARILAALLPPPQDDALPRPSSWTFGFGVLVHCHHSFITCSHLSSSHGFICPHRPLLITLVFLDPWKPSPHVTEFAWKLTHLYQSTENIWILDFDQQYVGQNIP